MTPQPDFSEILRRKRLEELQNQQGTANTVVADEPQPQVTQAQPSLNEGVLPFQAPLPPSARQLYEQEIAKEPKLSDYHPTRLRQAMSVIGGILGGIGTKSVGSGIAIGKDIKYAPFKRKEQEFQQGLAQKKSAMESEEAGQSQEVKLGEEVAKTGAEKSRAGAEEERRKQLLGEEQSLIPGTPEHKGTIEIEQAKHEGSLDKELRTLTLKDGTVIKGATMYRTDDGNLHYKAPDNRIISQSAIQSVEKEATSSMDKVSNAFQAEYNQYLKDNNYQTPPSEWVEATLNRIAASQGLLQERAASTEQKKAGTVLTKKRAEDATDVEIQQAKDFLEKHPEQYGNYVKQFSDIKRRSILAAVPPIALVGGQEQTRVANAHTALLHARSVRDLIEDPFIKKNMGPILGRIDLASSTFGGNPIGSTPEEAEAEQQFLSFLTSNLLWETTSGVGTRPARQTIELIKRTAPRASESYERIKGALDAQEKSAQNVIEGILYGGKKPEEKKKSDLEDLKEVQ